MAYEHPKLNTLSGGWYAVFPDGNVITEEDMPWLEVPNKNTIKLMGLKRHNKFYEFAGKEIYASPGETHVREIIINPTDGLAVTKQSLVGWFIGWYEPDGKVLMRVDAESGALVKEKIPYGRESDNQDTPS